MEIETLGHYQLRLQALELAPGQWDAYLSIFRFDEVIADFVCVVEKSAVGKTPFHHEADAIEAARLIGNQWIAERRE